jgi:hypothetical protein
MAEDRVDDAEWLYRSVGVSEILRDDLGNVVRVSSQAFADRQQEVSVDRATHCDHEPRRVQKSRSDAVAELLTGEVRGIRSLIQRDAEGREIGLYTIDVRPDPLLENAAHALIYADPRFASRSLFKRLQERLALMARFAFLPGEEEGP